MSKINDEIQKQIDELNCLIQAKKENGKPRRFYADFTGVYPNVRRDRRASSAGHEVIMRPNKPENIKNQLHYVLSGIRITLDAMK